MANPNSVGGHPGAVTAARVRPCGSPARAIDLKILGSTSFFLAVRLSIRALHDGQPNLATHAQPLGKKTITRILPRGETARKSPGSEVARWHVLVGH